MNTKTELNRRNFLRGVGVTLALPWMESLQAAAPKAKDSASPKRFLALYVGHGFAITLAEDHPARDWSWYPRVVDGKMKFGKSMAGFNEFTDQTTVVYGLEHPRVIRSNGHGTADSFLTGSNIGDAIKSPSIDQVAAGVDVVTDGLIQFAQRSERLGYQQTVSRTYRLLAQITGDPSFSTTSLHRRARMHTRRDDLEGAITLYRQLVSAAARPSDAAAFELELADLLLSTHQAQQSHDILQRLAISRDLSERERLRALELLAESGWQRDDLQVVRNTLERLAQSPAGFAVASVGFTELAVLEGTVELGRPYADSLVTTKPETAQANDALLWLRLFDAHIESPDALQQFATGRLRLRQGRLD